ncbi:hypothetical protein EHS25_009863 [Saitozyma podzolica]|uniref:Xylanolytic transcriptional activator regulatory domain-containing protein n=1 Tax=Saitozyma podzolica TaxID=1890683 RepID=A0A427YKD7_9TREE|nr:hypothetical protein EHS25_009863 [Saitozyma podzolica]
MGSAPGQGEKQPLLTESFCRVGGERPEGSRSREEQLEQILRAHGLNLPEEGDMRRPSDVAEGRGRTSSTANNASPLRENNGYGVPLGGQRRRSASPRRIRFDFDLGNQHSQHPSRQATSSAIPPTSAPIQATTSTSTAAANSNVNRATSIVAGPSSNTFNTNDIPFPLHDAIMDIGTASTSSSAVIAQPEQSSGTLVITHSGRSKYLGPRAANEWLRDQEEEEGADSPYVSRAPSPVGGAKRGPNAQLERGTDQFPFGSGVGIPSMDELLSRLPTEGLARTLIDSYFRYFAWNYDIVAEHRLRPVCDDIFTQKALPAPLRERPTSLFIQRLGLIYVVLAMGALHNLEMPPEDPVVEQYISLAKACLIKSNFLIHTTIAGVQTVHIMANVLLETERGRNGDSAWPMWGICMRMIQAMGIHRDGARWNLGEPEVEERRRAFWEAYAGDTLQANCFGRPNSMDLRYADAEFPLDAHAIRTQGTEKGYHTLKFELAQLSALVLHQTLLLQPPPYEDVLAVHGRMPFRCRAAVLALPSQYTDSDTAIRESPEIDKWDLHQTLQQFHLSLMVSEAIVNLHRPYFVRALQSRRDDPIRSIYGTSFLAVVERCNIACSLYNLHPSVSARYWFFWYHAFNSAVTLGTFIMTDPSNELAPLAISQMDQVINVYTMLVQSRASHRMTDNLRWLLRLRKRSFETLSRGPSQRVDAGDAVPLDAEDDRELLGWRTRLIQRMGKGVQKATTIVPPVNSTPSPYSAMTQTMTEVLQQQLGSNPIQPLQTTLPIDTSSEQLYEATDELLRSFWDPVATSTAPSGDLTNTLSFNWWDIDLLDPNGLVTAPLDANGATGVESTENVI